MATTYLFFIDDSGKNKHDTYVVRGGFLISTSEYIQLTNEVKLIKTKYEFNVKQEIKWSDLTSALYLKKRNPKTIFSPKKRIFYLQNFKVDEIKKYIIEIFSILPKYNLKIISTVAYGLPGHNDGFLYKAELQNLMQRIQHELKDTDDNAIFIYDSDCEKNENKLRTAYSDITEIDPFIKEYNKIIDSLFCETSNYSVGIQIADYIEGVISGTLRQYPFSKEIYKKFIFSKLRKNANEIIGYGIVPVPTKKFAPNLTKEVIEKLTGGMN